MMLVIEPDLGSYRVLEGPGAGASQGRGSSVAAFEPGDCARDDAATFGTECAFHDEREGPGTNGEYLINVTFF